MTSSLPRKTVEFIIYTKNCQNLSNSCSLVYNSCCWTPQHARNAQGKVQSIPWHGEAFAEQRQWAEQPNRRLAIRPRPKHCHRAIPHAKHQIFWCDVARAAGGNLELCCPKMPSLNSHFADAKKAQRIQQALMPQGVQQVIFRGLRGDSTDIRWSNTELARCKDDQQ